MNISKELLVRGIPVKTKSGLLLGDRMNLHDIAAKLNITMNQGGIRYNKAKTDCALITFLNPVTGEMDHPCYLDKFYPNSLIYTMSGQGVKNDQAMVLGNKVLRDHKANQTDVHLLQKDESNNDFIYCGQFQLSEVLNDVEEKDVNGDWRDVFKFVLTPVLV